MKENSSVLIYLVWLKKRDVNLHAVRVAHLVIQLHHGLVLADHTWSGGLPSTGHDGC